MGRAEIIVASLTAIVALYGAVLATYNLVCDSRRRKPRAKVTVSIGDARPDGARLCDESVHLHVGNIGDKSITLANCGLGVPKSNVEDMVIGHGQREVSFPCELVPGKGCHVMFPVNMIARLLESKGMQGRAYISAFFVDQIGIRYESNPIEFDVAQWSKAK